MTVPNLAEIPFALTVLSALLYWLLKLVLGYIHEKTSDQQIRWSKVKYISTSLTFEDRRAVDGVRSKGNLEAATANDEIGI